MDQARRTPSGWRRHVRIRNAVRSARFRIVLSCATDAAGWAAIIAAIGLVLGVLAERTLRMDVAWDAFGWSMVLGLAGFVAMAARIGRPSVAQAARAIDEGGSLNDSVTTAVEYASVEDGWGELVAREADARLESIRMGHAVPIRWRPGVLRTLGSLLAGGMAWWLLPMSAIDSDASDARTVRPDLRVLERELTEADAELGDAMRRAGIELDDRARDLDDPPATDARVGMDEDTLRRARVRRLTSVMDRLDAERQGVNAERSKAIGRALQRAGGQLATVGDGAMDQVVQSIAAADTQAAGSAINELLDEIERGQADEASRRAAGARAADLARHLDDARSAMSRAGSEADDDAARELRDRLADVGANSDDVDRALDDPEAIQRLIGGLDGLSAQQQRMLTDLASRAMASEDIEKLRDSLQRFGESLSSDVVDAASVRESAAALLEAMKQIDDLSDRLAALDQARWLAEQELSRLADDLGGLEGGEGQSGREAVAGPGERGAEGGSPTPDAGRGAGSGTQAGAGSIPHSTPTGEGLADQTSGLGTQPERTPIPFGSGPIIASELLDGTVVRGDSSAAFQEAVRRAASAASEAIESRAVPRDRRGLVEHYFGSLGSDTRDRTKEQ